MQRVWVKQNSLHMLLRNCLDLQAPTQFYSIRPYLGFYKKSKFKDNHNLCSNSVSIKINSIGYRIESYN